MKSNEKEYFNITLKEDDIITFDTNIIQPNVLLETIATANAATINILTEAICRDDVVEILSQETLAALEKLEALNKMQEYEGGETDESN